MNFLTRVRLIWCKSRAFRDHNFYDPSVAFEARCKMHDSTFVLDNSLYSEILQKNLVMAFGVPDFLVPNLLYPTSCVARSVGVDEKWATASA